jgi:HSP20 family protein
MLADDRYPRIRRRRRFPIFPTDIDEYFSEMDKYFEEMFKELQPRVPRDLVKERELPSGGKIREMGPFVYGYSITVGPDGKPVIREFGNIKPSSRGRRPVELSEKREPLVDVFDEKDVIRVISEIPGVEKSDISLEIEGKKLQISVDAARKYHKTVDLPSEVDPDSTRAKYTNGILEVTMKKPQPEKHKGKKINIE